MVFRHPRFFTFAAFGLLIAAIFGLYAVVERPGTPLKVIVAVLDTGIRKNAPEVRDRILPAGWNFLEDSPEILDISGHGTLIAKTILASGDDRTFIFPIKIAERTRITPAPRLAQAILYAVQRGARIVVLPFALRKDSPELHNAVREAAAQGVIFLAAAGRGDELSINPSPLSRLAPQNYPETVVVGSAFSSKKPNRLMNYGMPLDLVVLPDPETGHFIPGDSKTVGPDFAVARVAGVLARYLGENWTADRSQTPTEEIASRLRYATLKPHYDEVTEPTKVLSFYGAGVFDPATLLANRHEAVFYRFYNHQVDDQIWVEIFSDRPVLGVETKWSCPNEEDQLGLLPVVNSALLPKNRVRLTLKASRNSKDCTLTATLRRSLAETHEVEAYALPLRERFFFH